MDLVPHGQANLQGTAGVAGDGHLGCTHPMQPLWGSADDNAHGDTLEKCLLTHGLFVHNTGNINTFVAPTGLSIIYFTISKKLDAATLDGWQVDPKATQSD
jgi:hypothetical protein